MTQTRNSPGKELERRLTLVCKIYQSMRIAKIVKVEPPVFWGKGKIGMRKNELLDFLGTVQGVAIFLEAKSTHKPYLDFGGPSGLKKGQHSALLSWHRFGAMTGVIWEYCEPGKEPAYKFCPARLFIEVAKQKGRKKDFRASLRWDEGIPIPSTVRARIDFLVPVIDVRAKEESLK